MHSTSTVPWSGIAIPTHRSSPPSTPHVPAPGGAALPPLLQGLPSSKELSLFLLAAQQCSQTAPCSELSWHLAERGGFTAGDDKG